MEETKDRVPVIAGVIENSTRAAVERARAVADLRPTALQVTPVHYLFRPSDDAMVEHFDTIAERSGIPVMIYNVVPWSYLSTALLGRIFRSAEGVIGVKQSAGDMKAVADLLLLVEETGLAGRVRIITAVDPLLYPCFLLGADGAIAAILAAVPEWCVALWDATRAGDHEQARTLHRDLLHLWNALDAPNLPANVRAAMRDQDRDGGLPRAPMSVSSYDQKQRIRSALSRRMSTLMA
jgi:4-hydroxy-tetrahydrodipicolinate synthase